MATTIIKSRTFSNLPQGTDLDTVKYNYQGYVSYATNAPSGYGSGMIIVFTREGGLTATQLFQPWNKSLLFVRNYYTSNNVGTWNNWREVATDYDVGDTVTMPSNVYVCQGILGTNGKELAFIINLPKPFSTNISAVTFTTLSIRPMTVSGQLMSGSVLTSSYNVVCDLPTTGTRGFLRVRVTKADDTAWSTDVLTPVNVFLVGCAFTFS